MRNEEELAILQAYSRGEIGWRETCGALELTSVEMLHDALEKHHLPDPEATASADSEQIQKLAAFVTGSKRL